MAKRTRVFLLTAAGVLVAGLATGLIAWAMGVPLLAALGSSAPAELAYVPADAHMVSYVDVRHVMSSQLHDTFRQYERTPSGADSLQARTGINLETDIDRVMFASLPIGAAGPRNEGSLLIARGRFDEVRIAGTMVQQGGQSEQYHGKQVITIKDGSRDAALAFVETGVVLFGVVDSVHGAIDAKAGVAAGVSANNEFMTLVSDVDDGAAWTVAKFDALAGAGGLPPAVASQLPPINWLAASARVDGGVHGFVRADARDDQSAQNLRDVVQGFLALIKMQGARQPEFKGLLDSVSLTAEKNSVSLSFDVTPAALDALASGSALRRPVAPRRPGSQPAPQVF